jgi:hypothetical protein
MAYHDDEFSTREMRLLLEQLLNSLENISKKSPDIFSESVRENMMEAVINGFLMPREGYQWPDDYGLASNEANEQVKGALSQYVKKVQPLADAFGADTPHARLIIFQDLDVESKEGYFQDEFFVWEDFIG